MAKHIKEIDIKSYRGITDFEITDLGGINIIVGENNSGKSSLLEAIQILCRPYDFGNIVIVSRQRDRFRSMPIRFMQSQFSSFLNIFNKLQSELSVSLSCMTCSGDIRVSLKGEVKESLLSEDQIKDLRPIGSKNQLVSAIDEEVSTFFGKLDIVDNSSLFPEATIDVILNKYSRIMRSNATEKICPLQYISPTDHIVNDRFGEITRNKSLREQVVQVLQSSFNADIQDLRTAEDDEGRTLRMIEHRTLGDMPLSTYGDGIKKVIALANAAAKMRDGILLVDEYETSIHTKAMEQIFKFLIDVCKERNIQLFMTTHSEEALEKILQCNDVSGDIRVITMYKNADRTTARVLDGKKALSVKYELGLELR